MSLITSPRWLEKLIELDRRYRAADERDKPEHEAGIARFVAQHYPPDDFDHFGKDLIHFCELWLPDIKAIVDETWSIQRIGYADMTRISDLAQNVSEMLTFLRDENAMKIARMRENTALHMMPTYDEDLFAHPYDVIAKQRLTLIYKKTWQEAAHGGIGPLGAQAVIRMDLRPGLAGICLSSTDDPTFSAPHQAIDQMMVWLGSLINDRTPLSEWQVYAHIPGSEIADEILYRVEPEMKDEKIIRFGLRRMNAKPHGLNRDFNFQMPGVKIIESDAEFVSEIISFTSTAGRRFDEGEYTEERAPTGKGIRIPGGPV